MLLSIVVNLLSSVNDTLQSASQAASPLIPSWRRPSPIDSNHNFRRTPWRFHAGAGGGAQPLPPKKNRGYVPQIVARPQKLAVLLARCGQSILGEISKFYATIQLCQTLRLKYTKFDFRWGSATDPAGGAYCAPPNPLAVFKGRTSKGNAWEE